MDTKGPNLETVKPFEFELKTKIKFGIGESSRLPIYLEELGYKKIGLVVDGHVEKNNQCIQLLNETVGSFDAQVYSYVGGEPTYEMLEQDRNFFEKDIDCIIGVGGGSVIDYAKGLALLLTNAPKPAIFYRGFPTNLNKPKPVIAIPTTAGTGSEVTYNAVFISSPDSKKLGINTKLNFPVLALLDPLLIQSCPKSVMISSGMDALTHAIESYGATKSNDVTRMFSVNAMELLLDNLKSIDSETNINVCVNLQLGAYLAGIALMNSGSGPAGAMSYILGAKFHIPHGLAGAVFLPHIVDYNVKHGFKYPTDMAPTVFDICNILDIPYNNLGKFGIQNDGDLKILLDGIETLQPAFDQNPVKFTVEDAKEIVKEMI